MMHLIFRRGRRVGVATLIIVVCGILAGLLFARSARAQAAPTAGVVTPTLFVYLRGNDTVATETFSADAGALRGALVLRGQPSLTWTQQRSGTTLTSLDVAVRAPGALSDAAPLQEVTLTTRSDSVVINSRSGSRSRTQAVASRDGALPLVGQSVMHAAIVSRAARQLNKRVVPVFMASGMQTLDGTVVTVGDTTTLTIAGMAVRTVWRGDTPLEISVPAQGLRAVRATGPVTLAPAGAISYNAPVNAPYGAEQVTIPTARGYTLAGTFTKPTGRAGKVPVVITISGSGPQERDSRIPSIKGYEPFREIADTLGRRGIAVLRYDDRGVGASGGAESRGTATSTDFADDVQSVIAWLKTRPDVDPTRIALAGHSEGGLIAPIVAVREPSVRAIALLAGPAYDGRRILVSQNETVLKELSDVTDAQRDSLRRRIPASLDSIERANPWFGQFMRTDPKLMLRQVKQPVLILQGDTDLQVTREQADTIAATLRAAGNQRATLRHFPATNHLMLADSTGALNGYALLPNTQVRKEVLGALADWMVLTLR
ncbi:MAG TPA: alpha/beta fold hydrolase [Gemmatimonas sp.]|uniref:alpha/beta hydrolase family protein n=1 Tax=Gemmatimonas sp. TaxID=1962908 RepID=UPI002EDBB5B0